MTATAIPSAVTGNEAMQLRELARGRLVLEVGALLGFSTCVLASTALHVVSVDPHEGYPAEAPRPTLHRFLRNVEENGVKNKVTPIIGTDAILPMLAPRSFGLIFIDTTGEFEDTYRIIRTVLPLLSDRATLAVHDCGHPEWPGALAAVQKFAAEVSRSFTHIDRLAVFEGGEW